MSVLIVDDEEDLRESIADFIAIEVGCAVDEARSAQEALEKCRNQVFDLLIVDFRMPDMNGGELLQALSQEGNTNFHQPKIILSGFIHEAKTSLEGVPKLMLQEKPVRLDQFLDLVRSTMQGVD